MEQQPLLRIAGEAEDHPDPQIDIDHLTEQELIDLNHRIVERLRVLRDLRAHQSMLQFRIGQRVRFRDRSGRTLRGTLTKYNRKSVTVITHDGQHWNAAPALLQPDD